MDLGDGRCGHHGGLGAFVAAGEHVPWVEHKPKVDKVAACVILDLVESELFELLCLHVASDVRQEF